MRDLEESASHPLPLPEGVPQVVFDKLSYGVPNPIVRPRDPWRHRHTFEKIMKNDEKLMFTELTQEHFGEV